MNKYDRLEEITKLVNQKGTVRTNEIVEELNVSDMTVRRDLAELEEKGLLTKIHGGARSNSAFQIKEKSHQEKHTENIEEKRAVARTAVNLIEENDTIFRTWNNNRVTGSINRTRVINSDYELFSSISNII